MNGISIAVYLAAINLLGFGLMGLDKQKARRNQWRIPEKNLFLAALLGGSIGSWIGMYRFRHKTKHMDFVIGMPLIVLFQAVFAGYILWIYVNA